MFRLSPEMPEDKDEVEYLYDLTFAPGRGALSSYRLREGVAKVAELSLLAWDNFNTLAGAIRYWPIKIGPKGHDALLLGPVAVHPTRQGEGIGALLIAESLSRARVLGWQRVILIGDQPYYSRFGFERRRAIHFPPPTNPERLLTKELVPGAMKGVRGMVRNYT